MKHFLERIKVLVVAGLAICYVIATWQGHIHLNSDHEESGPCFLCQFHSSAGVPVQSIKHQPPLIHQTNTQSLAPQIIHPTLYAFAIRAPPMITC
ncbi:hypothetical protein [Zooshikella harenae]|uniref:DUF2607 family protein n=1 Tax=Zooshikella harenae TaxID=2827238 RepID=A0ABS5Z8A2_9GAMM|nr:hypothetical protein [Zooshikella harenae]MBU2710274.1 hypothetical protein [Zooshikella harenae]